MVFSKPIRAIGVTWYREADYSRILEIMVDASVLPETFQKWEESALRGEADLRRKSYTVERVYISGETFPSWCAERGLDVGAKARLRFTNQTVYRKYGSTS